VRLVNAALVLVTLLAFAGGYLQEKKRLETTRALPAARARDAYELAQRRHERVLRVVTGVLVAGAIASIVVRVMP
jgi:hypothetical protein